MSKFNDFSRFKNNELRSYFFSKEIDRYIKEKNKEKDKNAHPFIGAIFSALITNFIAGIKDFIPKEKYDEVINNLSLKILIYFIIAIVLCFIFICVYLFYMRVLQKLIDSIQEYLELRRHSRGIQNADDYKPHKHKQERLYLNKFNHEVVNQISLSLSIITHAEDEKDISKKLENRFYVGEAYRYLENALRILENQIITSDFFPKVLENNYPQLNLNRINEIVLLSTDLTKRINSYWTKEKISSEYYSESQKLDSRLLHIKNIISKKE